MYIYVSLLQLFAIHRLHVVQISNKSQKIQGLKYNRWW